MKIPAFSVIPLSWKIGAALALGFDAAVNERAARDLQAVVGRVRDNAVLEAKQATINLDITKAKDEELAPVVKRIYVDRVRVGAGTCGPAATAKAEDAAGSDGTDPAGRLVREDVERDTRALDAAVEQHLATGRACQAWGRENGFVP
jgi:hypothetical protein